MEYALVAQYDTVAVYRLGPTHHPPNNFLQAMHIAYVGYHTHVLLPAHELSKFSTMAICSFKNS